MTPGHDWSDESVKPQNSMFVAQHCASNGMCPIWRPDLSHLTRFRVDIFTAFFAKSTASQDLFKQPGNPGKLTLQ